MGLLSSTSWGEESTDNKFKMNTEEQRNNWHSCQELGEWWWFYSLSWRRWRRSWRWHTRKHLFLGEADLTLRSVPSGPWTQLGDHAAWPERPRWPRIALRHPPSQFVPCGTWRDSGWQFLPVIMEGKLINFKKCNINFVEIKKLRMLNFIRNCNVLH